MYFDLRGYKNDIFFKWDMLLTEYSHLFDTNKKEEYDYLGALFFGNFKLEFINASDGPYCNLFQYGAEDEKDKAYAYLEDGTPYEMRDELGNILLIPGNTFDGFAENIEEQIIRLLWRHPEYIQYAIGPTNIDKWYPGEKSRYLKEITREA